MRGARTWTWRHWERMALALSLLFFAYLKLLYNPGVGRSGLDGAYYYQIARNILEGEGFVTNVSLHLQGDSNFPQPLIAPPLWISSLAIAGACMGLDVAATTLPEGLYLFDLLLLFVIGRKLTAPDPSGDARCQLPCHSLYCLLLVWLFGSNWVLFEFTSKPYAEALAFFLLFIALLLSEKGREDRNRWMSAGGGLALALCLITRTQVLGAVLCVASAYLMLATRSRAERRSVAAFGCGLGIPLLAYASWLGAVHDQVPSVTQVVGLEGLSSATAMPDVQESGRGTSLVTYLQTRLGSFIVAFDPRSANSYWSSFKWSIYIVPIAGCHAVWHLLRRTGRYKPLRNLSNSSGWIYGLAGLGMVLPLHHYRFDHFKEWLFGWRHGLAYLLLVAACGAYLLRRGGVAARIATLGLLLAALVHNVGFMVRELPVGQRVDLARAANPPREVHPSEEQLISWIQAEAPRSSFVTTEAHQLGVYTTAYYHRIRCETKQPIVRALVTRAHARYVLVYPHERDCSFSRDLVRTMVLAAELGGVRVYQALAEKAQLALDRLPPEPAKSTASVPATMPMPRQ